MKLSKALTWDDLAAEYNKLNNGRSAQTLPMKKVFKWAEKQKDKFKVSEEEGTIHLIIQE